MSNFIYSVTDEWGTTYYPTNAGKVLLGIIIAALFAVGVILTKKLRENFDKKTKLSLTTTQICVCGMSLALGTVLSTYCKLWEMPMGGSITLFSMLAICLPGYFYGLGVGLLTGVAHGVLQVIIDPYVLYPSQLIVDYLLAFGALGLSGLFVKSKNALIKGYIAGIIGRFVFSVISGVIFFGSYAWEGWNPFVYSVAYNANYIFVEGIITVAILCIPAVKAGFERIKTEVTKN